MIFLYLVISSEMNKYFILPISKEVAMWAFNLHNEFAQTEYKNSYKTFYHECIVKSKISNKVIVFNEDETEAIIYQNPIQQRIEVNADENDMWRIIEYIKYWYQLNNLHLTIYESTGTIEFVSGRRPGFKGDSRFKRMEIRNEYECKYITNF